MHSNGDDNGVPNTHMHTRPLQFALLFSLTLHTISHTRVQARAVSRLQTVRFAKLVANRLRTAIALCYCPRSRACCAENDDDDDDDVPADSGTPTSQKTTLLLSRSDTTGFAVSLAPDTDVHQHCTHTHSAKRFVF